MKPVESFRVCCVPQAVVYPLAELTEAEDVTGHKAAAQLASQQLQAAQQQQEQEQEQQTDGNTAAAGDEAAAAAASAGDLGGEDAATGTTCAPAEQADGSSDPAAVLQDAQQQLVQLTMLLSSRNLWMRPAVLEAPAQDPQYLEAIHKVCLWHWGLGVSVTNAPAMNVLGMNACSAQRVKLQRC
jgi:hypothetical protein